MANGAVDNQQNFEREKWAAEVEFRRRELELKERERSQESARWKWNNPLVVAIFAATVAGLGNMLVTGVNDYFQIKTESVKADATQKLEEAKAESALLLEMIKTGDINAATTNLGFAVKTHMIRSQDRVQGIENTIAENKGLNKGPVLPSGTTTPLGRLQELQALYDKNFASPDSPLSKWADESLGFLRDNWRLGLMPIPKELAATTISEVYRIARESIIATNVGSTKFYFDNPNYVDSNVNARTNAIPVVRFYLYSNRQRIVMHDGTPAKDIKEFFDEVKELHKRLGSVYSAVIDVEKMPLSAHRDLLIMDNKFISETVLTPDWEPLRAQATEDVAQLRTARQYFRDIWKAVDPNYVMSQSDEAVTILYSHNCCLPRTSGNKRAEDIFNYLMNKITAAS